MLEKVNYDTNEITVYGNTYPLKDTCFQTVNRDNPAELLPESYLINYYCHSNNLKNYVVDMSFLMRKGSLYLPYNGNLLIHGCIPVDENGEMESFEIDDLQRPRIIRCV